ncbi:transporter [Pseudomonas aeruginosa]|nr:transporter [Pseudomonas aeruginosa]MCO2536091.1 transporter [Pseudomonas aeruginosa]PBV74166.1 transporter [Pseudomonas aeruginosa]RPT93407.1 transporter [Pseudomonas aeruginosa]RQA32258.1 transporter [Pseudomonas aeruginosa]
MLQAVGHVGADTEVLVFRPWNGWGSGGRCFHGALFSLLLLCAHCRQFDPKISRQMYTKFPTNL